MNRKLQKKPPSKVKLKFLLNQKEWPGMQAETMWAKPLHSKTFELLNSPFYAYGISFGDIVEARLRAKQFQFEKVLRKSGHSTYRLLLDKAVKATSARFRAHWKLLRALGCTYESASSRWLSIDVPPESNMFNVYQILEAGEREGVWTFDEGDCAHVACQAKRKKP